MPKKQKLKETLEMKAPGSSKFKKYEFRLEWEDRKLYYGKGVFPKSIDLAKTRGWDVGPDKQKQSKIASRREVEKRIISLRVWNQRKRRAVEGQLKIPVPKFHTWLYWLLVSMCKHADLSVLEEKLDASGLKSSRKGKISARRDMKAFDAFHRVFITYSEEAEKGKKTSPRVIDENRRSRRPGVEIVGEGGGEFGKIGKKLGEGGQAWVYEINRILSSLKQKSRIRGKTEPAVVKIPMGRKESIIKETRILAALGEHPNIIRLIDAVVTKDNTIYVFMEKGHGDLENFVDSYVKARKKLTIAQINTIALGIFAGLSHMHQRRIYHFDIKPENLLMFDNDRPKIMDFGLARTKLLYPGKEVYDYDVVTGTYGYIPPEGYSPSIYSKAVHIEKYDSYAVGMTIFRALIGSRYAWECPGLPELKQGVRYFEGDACKEINYWTKQYNNNRKRLDKDGLLIVSHVAWMMIQKDLRNRITVQEAFEAFKNACKESASGRRALEKFKQWKDKKYYITKI